MTATADRDTRLFVHRVLRPAVWLAVLLLPLAAAAAAAPDSNRYRVDLIVFADPGLAGSEQPAVAAPEPQGQAVSPYDRSRLAAAHIFPLPNSDFPLQPLWLRLQRSDQFQPLLHQSWIQTDPPTRNGPAVQLRTGPVYALSVQGVGKPLYQIDGGVALYGGDLLHIDADLTYTRQNPDGTLSQWHLDELRRIKLDELHFLDGGAFGLLVRVSRATPDH